MYSLQHPVQYPVRFAPHISSVSDYFRLIECYLQQFSLNPITQSAFLNSTKMFMMEADYGSSKLTFKMVIRNGQNYSQPDLLLINASDVTEQNYSQFIERISGCPQGRKIVLILSHYSPSQYSAAALKDHAEQWQIHTETIAGDLTEEAPVFQWLVSQWMRAYLQPPPAPLLAAAEKCCGCWDGLFRKNVAPSLTPMVSTPLLSPLERAYRQPLPSNIIPMRVVDDNSRPVLPAIPPLPSSIMPIGMEDDNSRPVLPATPLLPPSIMPIGMEDDNSRPVLPATPPLQMKSNTQGTECVVFNCAALRTHAIVPCGHILFCEGCARMARSLSVKCPRCQQPVVATARAFKSYNS